MGLAVIGILLATFLAGIPLAFSIGIATLIGALVTQVPIQAVIQQMIRGVDSFVLLAVPAFLLAGNLMNSGGITTRLFTLAERVTGFIPGNLAHASVVASCIFAGMTGSAVAEAGGLGLVEIKAMRENGFDPDFACAVTASAAIIGPIIPPSIPMVLYGAAADVSVARLFLGGFIPGLLMAASMMVYIYWVARRRRFPSRAFPALSELWLVVKKAFLALCTPVILLGGIFTGIVTPTEASILAVVYALLLILAVYKEITLQELYRCVLDSLLTTAIVGVIIAFSYGFSFVLILMQVPQRAAAALLGVTTDPLVILMILNVFFLIVGLFMDPTAAILVLTPILMPVIKTAGIDPVHFGLVMVLNLMIGLLTPPVGMVLYTVANVGSTTVERLLKELVPFYVPLLFVLLFITLFPSTVLVLPNLVMGR
jgi:tripartite ATP-independent transporter DctM subunit